MNALTSYPHLTADAEGVVHIGGTRFKLEQLAAEHYHLGWSADELLRQHPSLRPEEVYAALTYFYDHYDEVVRSIQQHNAEAAPRVATTRFSRAELLKRRDGST